VIGYASGMTRMHVFFTMAVLAISIVACERATPGHSPTSHVNSPRCVSDIECSQEQHCIKEEHRPDGICGK